MRHHVLRLSPAERSNPAGVGGGPPVYLVMQIRTIIVPEMQPRGPTVTTKATAPLALCMLTEKRFESREYSLPRYKDKLHEQNL
jgi:hypothetical protein